MKLKYVYFLGFVLFMQLSFDLIEDWIRRNPRASICTAEGVNAFKNVAIFQDYHGFAEFRKVCISLSLEIYISVYDTENKT